MTWKVHVDCGALGSQEKQTFHIGGFVWQCSQRRSPLFDIRSCSYHQIRSLAPTWMPFAITIILIIRFIFNQDFKPFFQINTCYLFFVFVKLNLLSLSLSLSLACCLSIAVKWWGSCPKWSLKNLILENKFVALLLIFVFWDGRPIFASFLLSFFFWFFIGTFASYLWILRFNGILS